MASELAGRVQGALEAGRVALFRTDLEEDDRRRARERFWRDSALLGARRDASAVVSAVAAELGHPDGFKANVAARLLTTLPWPEAKQALLAASSRGVHVGVTHLRYLGRALPIEPADFRLLHSSELPEVAAPHLAFALLRTRSPEGERLFAELVEKGQGSVVSSAVEAVANWRDPQVLRHVLSSWQHPLAVPPEEMPELGPHDVRLDAAFYLALGGDRAGIDYLMEAATVEPRIDKTDRVRSSAHWRCVSAIHFLTCLAWPGVVRPIADLLRVQGEGLLEYAISSAADIAAAALLPLLLDHPLRMQSAREEVLLVAEHITGCLPASASDPETTRQRTAMIHRTAMLGLDPALRYRHGVPLTLERLVRDLSELGPSELAAFNLWAMTGENGGFDPNDDLLANHAGLAFWRERARHSSPTEPGGWAYAGEQLPPPPRLDA